MKSYIAEFVVMILLTHYLAAVWIHRAGRRAGFAEGRKEGIAVGWLERDAEVKRQQQRHAAKKLRNFNPQN